MIQSLFIVFAGENEKKIFYSTPRITLTIYHRYEKETLPQDCASFSIPYLLVIIGMIKLHVPFSMLPSYISVYMYEIPAYQLTIQFILDEMMINFNVLSSFTLNWIVRYIYNQFSVRLWHHRTYPTHFKITTNEFYPEKFTASAL